MRKRIKVRVRGIATSALGAVNGGYEEGYEGGDFGGGGYETASYEAPAEAPAESGGGGGGYETASYEPGAYDTGTSAGGYETASYEPGAYDTGTSAGGYETASYEPGAYDTGTSAGYGSEMESANSAFTSQDANLGAGMNEWNAGSLAQSGPDAAGPIDAEQALRNLPLPEPVTPTFTEADLRQAAPVTQDSTGFNDSRFQLKSPDTVAANAAAELKVDIAQNYRDLASPPELYQTNFNGRDSLANCSIVSSLNEVASTEEGRAHLASRIESLGDGLHRVTLDNPDGSPNQIIVNEPGANVGTPGDANLRIFERAIAVSRGGQFETDAELYASIDRGAPPAQTLQQLGLTGPTGAGTPETLRRNDPSMADTALSSEISTLNTRSRWDGAGPYGLYANHAYQVTSTYANPESGERMVVLNNPWGIKHPQPIPESQVPGLFGTASVGRIPAR